MTIKQMADVAGVSPETIRRTGKDLFPERFANGKKTVFTQKQAVDIMQSVRKKNMVSVPTQSVEVPTHSAEVETVLTKKDMALISSLTAGIVSQVFENLNSRMGIIENRIEQRRELLPPKQMSDKKRISMIVNSYCGRNGYDQRSAYQELYRDFNYRYNTNVNLRAKNRGIRIIDQINEDGMLPELIAVASEIFAPDML